MLEAERADDVGGIVPVEMQVATAQPRRLHLNDHLTMARRRVGERQDVQLAATTENNATHSSLPVFLVLIK